MYEFLTQRKIEALTLALVLMLTASCSQHINLLLRLLRLEYYTIFLLFRRKANCTTFQTA